MTFQTVEQLQAQIASLTGEVERLREALNKIEDGTAFSLVHPVPIYGMGSDLEDGYFIAADFARAALQPKEGEG